MVDVFISYSRENQALVRRLADAVRGEGYSVWWDDELPPHRAYGDVITEQIGAAKAAIVVWSQSAAASEWVRAEADVARNAKKLVQVSIDDRMPPMPFNQLHYVSISNWQGEADHPGWTRVKESLVALCGAPSTDRPLHPMPTTPPPAVPQPPQPHKWHKLLIAVIAIAVLFLVAVGLYAWLRGGPEAPANTSTAAVPEEGNIQLSAPAPAQDKPVPQKAAPPPPPRAAASEPRPRAPPPPQAQPQPQPRAPVNLRAARRYCLGRGRNTSECRQLRAQYGY